MRSDSQPDSAEEKALSKALYAVDQLPLQALARILHRHVLRMLPSIARFAARLPDGRKQFRAVEATLDRVGGFAEAVPLPTDLGDSREALKQFTDVAHGDGGCFFALHLTLAFLEKHDCRLDFSTAIKVLLEMPHGADYLRALAFDADILLKTAIDTPRGDPSKLSADLGPLWPTGEPEWYRQEVADMDAFTERVPEAEKSAVGRLTSSEIVELRVAPSAYLRSVWAVLWTALRHPLQTTEIEILSGKVIRQY